MADADARSAIVDCLTAPDAQPARGPTHAGGDPVHGLHSSVVAGKGFVAVAATIRFLKERGTADRRLCAVIFDDETGRRWFYLVAAERDGAGRWVARPVGGGSDTDPPRPGPWLNFCGGWGQGRIYGGGRVHSAVEVARVRLTLASGTQLSDDADEGVALFFAEEASEPVSVDLYDSAARLLATHAP